MNTVVLLYGGRSTEHEIALRSARTIINELDRSRFALKLYYVDKEGKFISVDTPDHVELPEDLMASTTESRLASLRTFLEDLENIPNPIVFPMIHGQTGEDGEIQGLLQTLDVPYAGNGLTSNAVCMDKAFANYILQAAGIPKAPFLVVRDQEWADNKEDVLQKLEDKFGYPCFVKPANNGSSVGVNRATRDNVEEAIQTAFRYDHKIVIEQEIVGKELEVSVLGNNQAQASLPGSYTSTRELLDYDAKYNDETLVENVPHPLSEDQYRKIRVLALDAYHTLGCEGLARVDIFLDERGNFLINEINTMPGMTPSSLAPKLWTELAHISFAEYLNRILTFALDSYRRRKEILTDWGKE